jgi:hypothetical protein
MAKVTGPLMSLDASGTVGKTATFSKWKGQNYVRLRVTPKNIQGDPQAEVRTKLGVIGKMLSYVLYPTAFNTFTFSPFYTAAVANAPAGQSWISYAMKLIIGTGASTFDANHTAYGVLSGGNKTIYETAAALLGLTSFSLSYGAYGAIAAGEQLYHLASFAINSLSYTLSAGTLSAPDAGGLSDLVDWTNAV